MKRAIILLTALATAGAAFVFTACTHSGSAGGARETALFDGSSLRGWKADLQDPGVRAQDVWTVDNGILTCKGEPLGYLFKGPDVTDFRLHVEYRWAPGTKPGNSGVFSRLSPGTGALPKTIEVQLQHGSAGDVMGLKGRKVEGGQPRFFEVKAHKVAGDIAGVKKTQDSEKAPGEWNLLEIQAQGARYTVWMNGKLVNEVEGVEVVPGPIGIQSEGGVIQFRRITLKRL